MEFLEFITRLAPEGETFLVVEQKKKAWVPHLPTHRMAAGRAWYGNTGSFIVDRMRSGLAASISNCEYVLVMVLDDVGTKSKIPPLAPTWIIETSPGNYQYGYVFSEQPTCGDFAAAIKAIAVAGYTDGGAINPVRNFRLPGSINLKEGRDNFASVLVEFHPEREFTLTDICTALGVTPGPTDTAAPLRAALDDDGTDDVLAWLSESGHLLSQGNAAGWWGVTCPNADAHTSGETEGRYMPVNRAYKCLHEHCAEWGSAAFLQWVADQGGPVHATGLRDELLTTIMQSTLAKLTPATMFTEDAAAAIAAVEYKEIGRVDKADWYNRFAYVQSDDGYFDLITRREITRGTFNALFRHVNCLSTHSNRQVQASISFDELRQVSGARALVGITYAAGETVLCHRDGDVYGNRWRDARPPVGEGDITPWLDHCAALVPVAAEREHLFDVMAYKTQHANVKINHAVLHAGDEGCGKDTMWAPFLWAVCGPSLRNRGMMDTSSVASQWGYQLEAEIIVLNELKEPDVRERRALANHLKPIIAAPPEMLSVNRKGLAPYDMLNRAFVLAFSNDPVPISLASQDRRWFCVWSSAPKMAPTAARKMWDWYHAGGFAAVAGFLARRDVSKFNPAAAPFVTDFKLNLCEQSMSAGESFLVDELRARRGEFARGIIGSPFHALCDRLTGPAGFKVFQSQLLHALKEAGWIDCGRVASAEFPSKKHVFAAPEQATLSKSELRRAVEGGPPALTMVK